MQAGLELGAAPTHSSSVHTKAIVPGAICARVRAKEPLLQSYSKTEPFYLACRSCFRAAAAFHTETQLDSGISSGNWSATSGRTSLSLVSM
jgi:hypothetical protein